MARPEPKVRPIPRVRFLCVYLGRLPPWTASFLLTCRYNPDFEWLILTDDEPPEGVPDNVRFRPLDRNEFSNRVIDRLNVAYPEDAPPYKLCDYKPALGALFPDLLEGMEFWGFCDLDLLWGRISHFIDNGILDSNDLITARRHKVTGHFTLVRNCPEMNRLFEAVPGYVDHLTNPAYTHFDEHLLTACLKDRLRPNGFRRLWKAAFGPRGKTLRIHWDAYLAPKGSEQCLHGIQDGKAMKWRRGRAYDFDGREVMYLNFHKMKHSMRSFEISADARPESLLVDRDGIWNPTHGAPR